MQLSKKTDLDVVSCSSSMASLNTEPTSLTISGTSFVSDFDPHLPYPGCCSECNKTDWELDELNLLPKTEHVKSDVTVHSNNGRATTSSLYSGSIISVCSQEASDFSTSLSTTISRLSDEDLDTEEISTAEP